MSSLSCSNPQREMMTKRACKSCSVQTQVYQWCRIRRRERPCRSHAGNLGAGADSGSVQVSAVLVAPSARLTTVCIASSGRAHKSCHGETSLVVTDKRFLLGHELRPRAASAPSGVASAALVIDHH
jgi:hypothetical protein